MAVSLDFDWIQTPQVFSYLIMVAFSSLAFFLSPGFNDYDFCRLYLTHAMMPITRQSSQSQVRIINHQWFFVLFMWTLTRRKTKTRQINQISSPKSSSEPNSIQKKEEEAIFEFLGSKQIIKHGWGEQRGAAEEGLLWELPWL